MIRIEKKLDPPAMLTDEGARRELDRLCERMDGSLAKTRYNHPDVQEALGNLYHGKCAYCEVIPRGCTLEVDHYRPKGKVKINEQPPRNGYYWLSFEWSNLLPCCPNCNRAKGAHFPLKGEPVTKPPVAREDWRAGSAIMLAEQPLLLHPEIDDLSSTFYFETNGMMRSKHQRGQKTIELCGLNRDILVKYRLELLNQWLDEFNQKIGELVDRMGLGLLFETLRRWDTEALKPHVEQTLKYPYQKLNARARANREFSAFARHISQHLLEFTQGRLKPFQRDLLRISWQILQTSEI